ncbi:MAG TPA: BT4734/BF3469 family protein [Flavisolibacter sp.]|jgi:hypothetical protein|nr:BT4734/BF3469 family protein [Flavisolibacter sp.]
MIGASAIPPIHPLHLTPVQGGASLSLLHRCNTPAPNWLDTQVSLYECAADVLGRTVTFREILFTAFAISHRWYFKVYHPKEKWISGTFNDLDTIIDLRTREMEKKEKTTLKLTLQGFTPAALLKTRKQGEVEVISYTGLMQFDWDEEALEGYDLREVMAAVFSLPFVAFCSLSCSGTGFYALAAIAEPEKLADYAEHCFAIFQQYGIPLDTTKGSKANDLRYLSYDCEMLIRENPEPLKINRFLRRKQPANTPTSSSPISTVHHSNHIVQKGLSKIREASKGTRWQTVQQAAYTIGGLQDPTLLAEIQNTIRSSSHFSGEEDKYCRCAADCFEAGKNKPINKTA